MNKLGVAIIIILLISTITLSGCLDTFKALPSDEECQQKISVYLLEHTDLYDVIDTIYLDDWEGTIGCKTRTFEWCHPTGGEWGTYCGGGMIDCNSEIFFEE